MAEMSATNGLKCFFGRVHEIRAIAAVNVEIHEAGRQITAIIVGQPRIFIVGMWD